jgi:hypothetical protein
MPPWPTWSSSSFAPVLVLSLTVVLYPISYFVPRLFRGMLQRRGVSGRKLEIAMVVLTRMFGGVVLGGPSILLAAACLPPSPNRYGLNLDYAWLSAATAAVSWAVVWFSLRYGARVWPAGFKGYPEMAIECWDPPTLRINTVAWIVYLAGYEILFRGILLYPLAEAYGAWPSVLITTGLYCFTHLVKQPQEMFATIFVGVLFGVLGLWTGSLLGPFLVHSFTAPVTEYFAIRSRPSLRMCQNCDVDVP